MSENVATTATEASAPAPAAVPQLDSQAAPTQSATEHHAPTSTHPLGPLIRMRALKPSQVPAHPDLAAQQSSGTTPSLESFVAAVLEQAGTFMVDYFPQHFQSKGAGKSSPPSTATVEVLLHDIRPADFPKEVHEAGAGKTTEAWFARSSIHENAAKPGTASWAEFDAGLRADHSKHEKDYTPSLLDAHQVVDWADALQNIGNKVGAWTDVELKLFEMVHSIPTPLNDRLFTVIVIAGKKDKEFIDVQIPVDITSVASAKYNNNSKLVTGIYCSIERGTLIDNDTKVKWQMGTASDAKGNLPMWAQKMGVPGAVVKDVGYFVDWAAKERKGQA